MGLLKVQIMKYLQIMGKSSFSAVLLTFSPHGTASSTKKSLKKAKILNLEHHAMLLVKTFLIHNSMTKIFKDKHFLKNTNHE